MAAFYVFVIMMVSWYAGKAVINTFGISIPGLRIAGGMIVAFIGFNMLFPQDVNKSQSGEKGKSKNIAFIPWQCPVRQAGYHCYVDQCCVDIQR